MSIQNIVNVQISRQTSTPSRAGFGTGAFITQSSVFNGRTKIYASAAEVNSDDLAGADLKAAAAAYFGQSLAPTKLTAIKRKSAKQQFSTLTFDADFVASNSIVATIDGVDLLPVVFTTDQNTTLLALRDEIETSLSVTAATVTASRQLTIEFNDNVLHTVTAVVTGGASQPVATSAVTIYPDTDGTLTETLTDAVDSDNDWYALACYSRDVADVEEVSDWVQGQGSNNPKIYFAQASQADILDGALSTDIASVLQAKANFRTSVWYHATDSEYLDAGVIGGQLPTAAGSITWAYKTVSGVAVDTLTDGQKSAAHDKACNTYTTEASVNITEEGKVSDSPFEWIDVIRGVDWIQVNMTADLYELLVKLPKIPYDSKGLGLVKGTIQNRLLLAVNQGILTGDTAPTVSVPDLSTIPAADRANRVLNNVTFTGVLAGAIQKINVLGTVTL